MTQAKARTTSTVERERARARERESGGAGGGGGGRERETRYQRTSVDPEQISPSLLSLCTTLISLVLLSSLLPLPFSSFALPATAPLQTTCRERGGKGEGEREGGREEGREEGREGGTGNRSDAANTSASEKLFRYFPVRVCVHASMGASEFVRTCAKGRVRDKRGGASGRKGGRKGEREGRGGGEGDRQKDRWREHETKRGQKNTCKRAIGMALL